MRPIEILLKLTVILATIAVIDLLIDIPNHDYPDLKDVGPAYGWGYQSNLLDVKP